jgi:hypothetical protein
MLLVRVHLDRSPLHGLGVFAAEPIPKGTVVWRFTPGLDLDLDPDAVAAQPELFRAWLRHHGYLDPRLNRFILCCDHARFLNHSDTPNLSSDLTLDHHGVDIASRDIAAGEELTIDYEGVEGQRPASRDAPAADPQSPRTFRTLRGFLDGTEPDEADYFHYGATLRIHGANVPLAEIGERLGVQPTHVHRRGERRGPSSPGYRDDAWHYQPAVPETEPLERHLEALWQVVRPALDYLKALKRRFHVDVFCGYRSNCDHAGFEVPHRCLELFTALEVPFGVSVIIA